MDVLQHDIRFLILRNLPDLPSVASLVLASRQFYETFASHRQYILRDVLLADLGEERLQFASIVYFAGIHRDTPLKWAKFVESCKRLLEGKKIDNTDDYGAIAKTHRDIGKALSHSMNIIDEYGGSEHSTVDFIRMCELKPATRDIMAANAYYMWFLLIAMDRCTRVTDINDTGDEIYEFLENTWDRLQEVTVPEWRVGANEYGMHGSSKSGIPVVAEIRYLWGLLGKQFTDRADSERFRADLWRKFACGERWHEPENNIASFLSRPDLQSLESSVADKDENLSSILRLATGRMAPY